MSVLSVVITIRFLFGVSATPVSFGSNTFDHHSFTYLLVLLPHFNPDFNGGGPFPELVCQE